MIILDRYIMSQFLKGMLPVLLLLLALFSLLALAEALEDVGKVTFRQLDAFLVVLYTSPRRIVDLLPVTALLGGLMGLGILAILLGTVGLGRAFALTIVSIAFFGWLILIAIKPLALNMQAWGLFWLVGGGVAYMAGLAFYAAKRVRYCHFVWHLFVIAGTACHVVAVRWYAA